jgi:hypothetical protein
MDTERLCPKCKIVKNATLFQKNKRRPDGLSFWCKDCSHSYVKENRKSRNIEPQRDIIKTCQGCKKAKQGTEFPAYCRSHDGLFGFCKECKSKADKKSHRKHKKERNEAQREHYYENRERISAHRKELRNDPEFIAKEQKYNRDYREKNKKKLKKKRSEYYQHNKKRINERFVEARHNNLNFRLKNNLRTRLWHAVKFVRKKSHMIDYLGCSIEELREHLERLFQPDMTWENYGSEWHIDHIKPCCDFDLTKEEEISICFHFTNLQPLWAEENMSKNKYGQAKCSRLYEILDTGSNPNQP